MQGTQISFLPNEDEHNPSKKQKKPKLGRYERIKRELDQNNSDPYKIFTDVSSQTSPLSQYTFVDLFCGAGGITQGLFQAGFTPLASVEISQVASATHKKNFPQCHHFCGDIEQFSAQDWLQQIGSPDVNVVVGGPPCQGFSVAGKRDPKDPRNRLFYEFVRVVSEIRPWYVVMENVPGILTIQKGDVKTAIIEAFESIGYPHISVAILESAAYGVPQIRPRAIFIANRFGMPNPYPQSQLNQEEYKPIESAISDLPEYTRISEINHEWTKHSQEYMERLAQVPPGGSLYEKYVDAFKRQYPGKPSMTVKENHGGTHIHPYLNRVISAREMARLQTFPDSFIFEGSMKKAMWQIGNAVPPRLAECIGYGLIPSLNNIYLNQKRPVNFPHCQQTQLTFD
ncbi:MULTISPECIES: DNA cytosine methyltransferase [unclassified Dolichospermum]|uniref:DNA cytosine methyltransferase n=1 Tax=unclassified Dolichospermum TaxID=2622029 RepID=UPI001445DB31|nr:MULTISPECIES: DNA cytosine methyltransferase [unclassified Dolichospermum]MBO1050886.1 DNA cytosine methyltransferase [Dolichospermum sp. DET73]MTJ19539.1 DNA cytosine methyltransferase [Dolichospermum sp. UHCC 0299]MTJ40145.1 DNA cytosine methyltransferase [Dolichospermum sp. UHCC 0406]